MISQLELENSNSQIVKTKQSFETQINNWWCILSEEGNLH